MKLHAINNLGRKLVASSILLTSFAHSPVFAEAAGEETWLEEIVVTARKQEEAVQDIPIAITAISEELKNSTIRDLVDLNGFAPNVTIGEDGSRGGGGAVINIRGISPTRSDDNSFDAPIAVMVDGIHLGSLAGQVLENFDLERIEIMRGPQGTLFGKNTVGGVIHVLRTRPTGELGARFKVTAGDDGQQELRAVVNTSLIEDTLAAKFFATTIKDDGYYKNVTIGGANGKKDYKAYGVTFLWTPSEKFEALFTIEKFDDNSELTAFNTNYNTPPGVLPPPTDPNDADYSGGFLSCLVSGECRTSTATPSVSENDTRNDAKLETDAIALTMNYEINDNLTLVSVTGYRDLEEYRIFDFDGSAAPFITIERWNEYDQFSQELRLDGAWENVNMTAGLYYFDNEFEQDWVTGGAFWSVLFGPSFATPGVWQACQTVGIGVFCDTGIPAYTGQALTQILYEAQETTSIAAFGQVDWTFSPDWTLTLGLRWTEEEKDFIAGQAYLSDIPRQHLRNFPDYSDLDNKWTEWSPKIGITYRINDSSIVYATYSEGFHSGGFFGVNQNTSDFERDQYDPEFAESYEVGYKSTLLDSRLRLNITAFLNDFTDKQESSIQVDDVTKTVASVFDNVADARYQGVEIETEYAFNRYFRAFLNYGYLDASYKTFFTDINAGDGETIIEDASHLIPRNAPEHTLGLGGTVTVPMGNGYLEMYAKFAKIDDVESNLLNTPLGHVDAREDVTASIGYYAQNWALVAYGRNLTDEQVEIFTPIGENPGLFASGSVNRGRNYAVEFSYNF
jgi:iron complex outermembrane receptor protein